MLIFDQPKCINNFAIFIIRNLLEMHMGTIVDFHACVAVVLVVVIVAIYIKVEKKIIISKDKSKLMDFHLTNLTLKSTP